MPEPEPHRHRQVAESFGTDTERYDRTRPPYPDALVDRIVAASPGTDVLDVGCGTGIEALDQLPTLGALTQLQPDKMAKVLDGVGAAIDAMGGSFRMRYTTVAVAAARTLAT